ncbi:hypothetical protein D3C84_1016050 [compost metagenome]
MVSQDQTVTMHSLQRRVELQLGKHPATGKQQLSLQQRHPCTDILSAQMHMDRAEMGKAADFTGQ